MAWHGRREEPERRPSALELWQKLHFEEVPEAEAEGATPEELLRSSVFT